MYDFCNSMETSKTIKEFCPLYLHLLLLPFPFFIFFHPRLLFSHLICCPDQQSIYNFINKCIFLEDLLKFVVITTVLPKQKCKKTIKNYLMQKKIEKKLLQFLKGSTDVK